MYEFIAIKDTAKKDLQLIPKKNLFNLKLYFVSSDKNLKELYPRVPKSIIQYGFENSNIRRVCFAPSIEQCLLAVPNVKVNKTMFVYVPKHSLGYYKFYKCEMKEVIDSDLTDEYWCLDKIEIEPIYKIKITNITEGKWFKYGVPYNYEIIKTYNANIDDNNILDFAVCNGIEVLSADKSNYYNTLSFKTRKDAETFYKKCAKVTGDQSLDIIDNTVYFTRGFIDSKDKDYTIKTSQKLNHYQNILDKIKKNVDKYEKKAPYGNQNCMLCTWSFIAQVNGIDMLPRPVYYPNDVIFKKGDKLFKNSRKQKFKNAKELKELIKDINEPYYIHVDWKTGGGHEFILMNIDNYDVFVIDPQEGLILPIDKAKDYFKINYDKSYIINSSKYELDKTMLKYNDMKYLSTECSEEEIKKYL